MKKLLIFITILSLAVPNIIAADEKKKSTSWWTYAVAASTAIVGAAVAAIGGKAAYDSYMKDEKKGKELANQPEQVIEHPQETSQLTTQQKYAKLLETIKYVLDSVPENNDPKVVDNKDEQWVNAAAYSIYQLLSYAGSEEVRKIQDAIKKEVIPQVIKKYSIRNVSFATKLKADLEKYVDQSDKRTGYKEITQTWQDIYNAANKNESMQGQKVIIAFLEDTIEVVAAIDAEALTDDQYRALKSEISEFAH